MACLQPEAWDNAKRADGNTAYIHFEGFQIFVKTDIERLAFRIRECFGSNREIANNIIDSLTIKQLDERFTICRGEQVLAEGPFQGSNTLQLLYITQALVEAIVSKLALARKHFSWFRGMAFGKNNRSLLLCGDAGDKGTALPDALCTAGWELLADQVIPVRYKSDLTGAEIVPLVRCTWPKGAAARVSYAVTPLNAVVFSEHYLHNRGAFSPLSPAVGAAELSRFSVDFKIDRKPAVERICKLAEQVLTYQLNFSRAESVADRLELIARLDLPDHQGTEND